jgi:hypothetical protein
MTAGIIVGHLFLSTLSVNLAKGIQENAAIAELASERIEPSLAGVNATATQNTPETQLLVGAGKTSKEKSIAAATEMSNLEQSR